MIGYIKRKLKRIFEDKNRYIEWENKVLCIYGKNAYEKYEYFIKKNKKLFLEMGKLGLTVDDVIEGLIVIYKKNKGTPTV